MLAENKKLDIRLWTTIRLIYGTMPKSVAYMYVWITFLVSFYYFHKALYLLHVLIGLGILIFIYDHHWSVEANTWFVSQFF